METAKFSLWRYRFAVLTALSTFPLLFLGGLVTSRDAGMAVHDWPTSFGYNMFTFPISQWVGDIFYEHVHRLLGSLVGFLTIILALWVQFTEQRAWVRKLAWAVLAAVIFQGLLGGLRVVLVKQESLGSYVMAFAVFHGCFAQAFLVLICFLGYFQSREWSKGILRIRSDQDAAQQAQLQFARRWVFGTIAVVYLQLILGAVLRHTNTGVIYHASFAVAVVAMLISSVIIVRRILGSLAIFRELTLWIATLVMIQVSLGVLSWMALPQVGFFQEWQRFLILIPTCHQITGALILLASAFLALRLHRVEFVAAAKEASPVTMTNSSQTACAQPELVATAEER